jgi:hypothetical protein
MVTYELSEMQVPTKQEVIELLESLSPDEQKQIKLPVGRPPLREKLEVIGVTVSKELAKQLQQLARARGKSVAAICRELIVLGLGASNGESYDSRA